MNKRYKRFLAKAMVVVMLLPMVIGFYNMEVATVNAAELPIVNEAIVTERVKELAKLLEINNGNLNEGAGVLFTANGKACGHATGNAGNCTNCKNTYVVNTAGNWFNTKFGYTINPDLLPGHCTPAGNISNKAWTCAGFVNFALWYIAKADSSSDVYRDLLGSRGAAFTKSNLQKFDIRIGDVVRVPELYHSFMFLGYVGDNAIKVLDCNWVNKDASKIAQVKIHTINLNSNYTMAITRAINYKPDYGVGSSTTTQPTTPTTQPDKIYGTLDLSATSWTGYNVGLDTEMNADKAYTIRHGAQLIIIGEYVNSKGNKVYHVYSEDLEMNCFVTAKYVKLSVSEPNVDAEPETKVEQETTVGQKEEQPTIVKSAIGWIRDIKNRWRYIISEDGNFAKGWFQTTAKLWYYLSEEDGYMHTSEWFCDPGSGLWYYLDDNGAMCTGWITVDDIWYYLDRDGAMCTGWNRINDNWYLFGLDGAMLTGWQEVGGKCYYMDENGKCLVNTTTPDGYKVDENGAKIN